MSKTTTALVTEIMNAQKSWQYLRPGTVKQLVGAERKPFAEIPVGRYKAKIEARGVHRTICLTVVEFTDFTTPKETAVREVYLECTATHKPEPAAE